jgi:hypothetical protein
MMRPAPFLVGCAMLAGCTAKPPTDALFPLEAGHRWTYRVTTQSGDDTSDRETLTLRTLGAEDLPLLDTKGAFRRRSDTGIDYWLRADETGIYRVASKTDIQAEAVLDKPLRFVLKAPYTVGTQWQATTTSYLLMRRSEFPREIRHSHPSIPMNYQIEAVDERVETPAGPHSGCLRVKGVGSVRVYADPASGWRDMPLTTTEWYCKGVGLVKVQRDEPAQSAFLTGGSRTLELVSWE